MSARIGLLDIETAPNVGYVWGKYDQTVIEFVQNWYLLCWTWKWLDDDAVEFQGIEGQTEEQIIKSLWEKFNQADVIVAHNGDAFDIKRSNARFVTYGLRPPSPYKTVDTLKLARKYFKFESNKLGDLGQYLELGGKVPNFGFNTWKGCMSGDAESWRIMREYNIRDVLLLEQIYRKLRPWADNHPDLSLFGDRGSCPNCGGNHIQKRGFSIAITRKYQRLHCQDCGSWFKGPVVKE
jgi:DNA polymerase elongation subunit (family B)